MMPYMYFYMFLHTIFQFNNDKDDREIRKIGGMKFPEGYPWLTIKTENDGKT